MRCTTNIWTRCILLGFVKDYYFVLKIFKICPVVNGANRISGSSHSFDDHLDIFSLREILRQVFVMYRFDLTVLSAG